MRESFFVTAFAGFVGAIVGAGATTAFRPAAAPIVDLDAKPIADAVEKAVERAMARNLVETRRAARTLREEAQPVDRPASDVRTTPAAGASPRDSEDASSVRRSGDSRADRRRDSPFATSLSAPDYARFAALADWADKPEVRRTWLFADESTCLSWFGAPDDIGTDATGEMWYYNEPLPDADGDGKPDGTRTQALCFRQGRLVRVDTER